MDVARLARELEDFLAAAPHACVLEQGDTLFDLTSARYSVSGENGKCLLHLWSEERNAVRRVVDLERKQGQLRLAVQRFGKGKPSWLEIVADRERRAPAVQRQVRLHYQRLLGRALERHFSEWRGGGVSFAAAFGGNFRSRLATGALPRGGPGS